MKDDMLSELYKRVFASKAEATRLNSEDQSGTNDRLRQVAIAENRLLNDLINIRTDQIRREGIK